MTEKDFTNNLVLGFPISKDSSNLGFAVKLNSQTTLLSNASIASLVQYAPQITLTKSNL